MTRYPSSRALNRFPRGPSTLAEHPSKEPLLLALHNPETVAKLSESGWADLLARAREAWVLARLERLLAERRILDRIPEKARLRLSDTRTFIKRNQTDIRFEVNRVTRALSKLDVSIILLKGAAYLFSDLPPAGKRFASDLDIMVETEHLDSVERTLLASGWQVVDMTDYDKAYFRKWMHEIPPLWHPDRLVAVDIHHTIIPLTSRYRPDTEALFAAAVQLGDSPLWVLCPSDMVLHGAVHLFNEEFLLGIRDLADLHDLLEHFGKTEGFWGELLDRSSVHGLGRILYYLLRYTRRVFGIEIPTGLERAARAHAPNMIVRAIMDLLVMSALTSSDPRRARPQRAIALWFLYIRSHWLKMPPLLLARHLLTKTLYRRRARLRPTLARAETKPN